jgi:hypothetical protein
LYKYIKDKTKVRDVIRAIQTEDDTLVTSPKAICDTFSTWFHSVFRAEDTSNLPYVDNILNIICPQIKFNEDDIDDRLKQLDGSKSIGHNNIHPYVLKQCSQAFSVPLCLLFQKSLDLGVVPQSWKLANITPVHKNGSKLSPNNYRGISLTSVLCKLLERIVGAHIYNHLICNNILSKNQHGFVPRRSTTTNLLETMDIITGSLNEGLGVDVIYLDFIKAFDRVAHARLVLKLRGIGLTGMLLSWCVSFLVNRKQRVVMGENMGDWMSIDSGVPQGSVLGPLFFIIYINDLISSIDIPIKVYADDTKLIIAYKDSEECVHGQNALYIISEWTKLWLLYLNIDKCKVLHLGELKTNNKTMYYLNGIPLQTTEFEKDLGIIVNHKLNWTQHITKICINATY